MAMLEATELLPRTELLAGDADMLEQVSAKYGGGGNANETLSFYCKEKCLNNKNDSCSLHQNVLPVALARLDLSCCTVGLRSLPALSLCLEVRRRRPVGGTACKNPTLGGTGRPSFEYSCSISLL